MANSVPFEIERSECEIGNTRGYNYRLIFDGDRTEGVAELLFNSVEFYECSAPAADRFRALGLQPGQMVAHLNRFYPNGEGIPDDSPLMGQGVGTAALERIVADAKERGATVLYVFSTGRSGMAEFLERKGFEIFYPKPRDDGTRPHKFRLATKLL